MKFGKSIGSQQEGHVELHYVEYKLLKRRIKDVVVRQQAHELAEALTANTGFEEELSAEITQVNDCFARRQRELLERTAALAEELQSRRPRVDSPGKGTKDAEDAQRASAADEGAEVFQESPRATAGQRPDAFRTLVGILKEVDQLRKYAVWNAVGVVKILKKRRKQTCFGLEDTTAERAGWLSRQSFFSGSDFAELHAAIESLGHMLVLSELAPGDTASRPPQGEPQQCPICLDTISDMVELSCEHRFCWKCFVLGPIAHQPGEYRITQCPICRRETARLLAGEADAEGDGTAEGVCVPSSEGLLTRFLHTYFPQDRPQRGAALWEEDEEEEREARREGARAEREMRDVVGELVKVLLTDAAWQRPSRSAEPPSQRPPERSAAGSSGSSGMPSDFFQTLPHRSQHEKQLIGAAQKLQWLQLASTGDPLALDGTAYCSLCSEPLLMEAVVTTPCKHYFHRVCINRLDMPRCPLCADDLPFAWFLPPDHPCSAQGFRIVAAKNYRPQFPGGPSRGTCGYPLRRPPPMLLRGGDGLMMKSYLHRLVPTGEADCCESPVPSPSVPESIDTREDPRAMSSASDSSSSEGSSSAAGILEDLDDEEEEEEGEDRKGGERIFAYGAIGKLRLVPTPPSHPPAKRLARRSAAAAAALDWERWGAEQRNPTVLLIGDHL